MTSQAPEAASGPPLARESAMGNAHYQVRVANRPTAPTLTDSDPIALLARVAELEAELAVYRPPKPPPGWLPVKVVADKLRLSDVAVYRAASEGRITSTKIGRRVWIAPIETRPPRKRYKSRY